MRTFAIIIFVFLGPLLANACSYVKADFTWKTQSSDLIIKGKVQKVNREGVKPKTATAIVEIQSLIKGDYKNKSIEIQIDLTNHCPGPAKYVEGDTVITFLKNNSTGDVYISNGAFHGVESFQHESIRQLYEKRITELVRIQKITSDRKRKKEITKWAISCARNKETRHIAAEEFSRIGFNYKYNEKEKWYKREKHSRLTIKQKKELRKILFSIQDFKWNDSVLLESITRKTDKKLIDLALLHLENHDKNKRTWYKEVNLMTSIVKITRRKDLKLILDQINKISIYSKDLKLKTLTDEFINKV